MKQMAAVSLKLGGTEDQTKEWVATAERVLNGFLERESCPARIRLERHNLGHHLAIGVEWGDDSV